MKFTIKQQWKNAKKTVKELKKGEWKFNYSGVNAVAYTAERGDLTLWFGLGGFFTDIQKNDEGINAFGLFFRHYVWWHVAKKLKDNQRKLASNFTKSYFGDTDG